MKKTALCLITPFLSGFLTAQTVGPDASFGINGKVITGLNGNIGNPYGIDFVAFPDGKTIIGGSIAENAGLEKYNDNGTPDPMFSSELAASDGMEVAVARQMDGKVLLAAENPVGLSTFVARIDTLGHLDLNFGNGGMAQTGIIFFWLHHVFVQSDGKILVFGDEWNNTNSFAAVRFLPDGTLDTSFAVKGVLRMDVPNYAHEVPVAVAEQTDHKLIFAGTIGYPNTNVCLLRIRQDGSIDKAFGQDGWVVDSIYGNSNAYALAIQPDGKIVITGDTGPAFTAMVARYEANGARDAGFGNQGVLTFPELKEGIGVALRPDGKILTANWSNNSTLGNLALAQMLPNGQKDETFGNHGIFRTIDPGMHPRAMSLTGNKAVVSARNLAGASQKRLFRFLLDLNVGNLDPNGVPDNTTWLYPNPIADAFSLKFELTEKSPVSIRLFDWSGKMCHSFAENQYFEQGANEFQCLCPGSIPAGNYILALEIDGKRRSGIQVLKQ